MFSWPDAVQAVALVINSQFRKFALAIKTGGAPFGATTEARVIAKDAEEGDEGDKGRR